MEMNKYIWGSRTFKGAACLMASPVMNEDYKYPTEVLLVGFMGDLSSLPFEFCFCSLVRIMYMHVAQSICLSSQ